jgi:hypothetical protein
MPSDARSAFRSLAVCGTALIVLLATGVPSAEAGRRHRDAAPAVSGDLALSGFEVRALRTRGAVPRMLLRVVVENRGPNGWDSAYAVAFRGIENPDTFGLCRGDGLAAGARSVCHTWVPATGLPRDDGLTAAVERDDALDEWDVDETNDRVELPASALSLSGDVPLRVASFEVRPHVLQGMGEVRYSFTVEKGHLAWLLVQDEDPMLVGGHPDDGLLTGSGKVRIRESGPVTIVARDTTGEFVYRTVMVTNVYEPARKRWDAGEPGGDGVMTWVSASVLDSDEAPASVEEVMMAHLRSLLSRQPQEPARTRPLDLGPRVVERPTNVANPKRDDQ